MRPLRTVLPALLLLCGGIASPARASTTIVVRGGWVADADAAYCNPTKVTAGTGTPPPYVMLHCIGGQAVDGSFMGHSIVSSVETVYTSGAVTGTFDEWIYGMYWYDGSIGGLHVTGTFSISSRDGGFVANGTIVGGTCDFAGSSGTLNSTGYVLNGGYSGNWVLPAEPDGFTPSGVCAVAPTLP